MINRDSENTIQTQLLHQNQFVCQQNQKKSQSTTLVQQKKRIVALDVYRGLTMVGMIMVDNQGSHPPWYQDHPQWNGITPADFVFPSFLFIMGFAVPLSVTQKNSIKIKNILRIIGLFIIGIFITLTKTKFNFQHVQIMGILQRLSLCYASILVLHVLTKKGKVQYRIYGLLTIMIMSLIYVACMLSFDKPQIGCPKQLNLTIKCNFASYWDKKILNQSFQPQGLFSTLTAFGTTYFGYLFCLIFKDNKNILKKTLLNWMLISIIVGLSIYPLTFIMPFNKKIYSISFLTLMISFCGIMISLFVYILDVFVVKHEKTKKIVHILIQPFMWLGKNPLIIFVLISVWRNIQVYVLDSWISNIVVASVLFSFLIVIFWTLFAGLLNYKKIYIKL